jgi:hypothetical protein
MATEHRPRVETPSTLDLKDFYTPAKEAGRIIQERWQNAELRKAVEDKFGNSVPKEILDGPNGVLWRQIGTPDREFARFLDLAKEANIQPMCFETVEDKFVKENFTKLGLTNLPVMTGLTKDGKTIAEKVKIIDFNQTREKRMCDIKTLWGEPLVDFHHWWLRTIFPVMENRVVDIYKWIKNNGATPEEYYPAVMAFALCYYILFDDYDLLAAEDEFTLNAVLPAFKKIETEFGLCPLIVKISKPGEHTADPYWWCYAKETRNIMEKHKQEFVWT